jgi:hypothetical protein
MTPCRYTQPISHNPGITTMPIGTTITEYIIEEQRRIKGVSGDFHRIDQRRRHRLQGHFQRGSLR